jgi:RNA polymerase sigma factor (TIGR02999 family)
MNDVTRILSAIDQGDRQAAEQLLPLVYDELRKLAAQRMVHENPGQTLQATALVHEAYLRLVDVKQAQHWNSRGHFFAAAAEAMRRILIERARRKGAGDRERIPLDDLEIANPAATAGIIAVDEALSRLENKDSLAAQLVKLRFFAGLTMEQAAQALGMPLRSAERNWTYARTWLQRELSRDHDRVDR